MNDDCNKKNFKPPVSWLMGRELLAGLKWIMAYSFMGDKQDPKDWMYTSPIKPPRSNNNASQPYWFDYIADTGDGMRSVYNIAYLCMSELWIDDKGNIGSHSVSLTKDSTFTQPLPRGEFLFVGGDTAYHIADSASLKERFQTPFNCAALDVMKMGKTVDQRPIYGIPANHDYYDALDGFNRQFCQPIGEDTYNPLLNDPKDPQLGLLGFERTQNASYVALNLPFGWRLWGLDSQNGKMDKRQQAFFVSSFHPALVENGDLFNKNKQDEVLQELQQNAPEKLIVATPEPSTVFGKWAKDKDSIVETFKHLGLDPCFLQSKSGQLKGKSRLDISGDIHHYERYWGSSLNDPAPSNYTSVVAGGGGAFLHPSHTDIDEVTRQVIYPSAKDSHNLFTRKILNPWNIFCGGYIWLAGALIALLSYFAVTIPQSSWSLFKLMPDNLRLLESSHDILLKIKVALDDSFITQTFNCCSNTYYFDLIYILLYSAFLGYWLWKTPDFFKKKLEGSNIPVKYSDGWKWISSVGLFILPVIAGFLALLFLLQWSRELLPHSFLSGGLIDLFFITSMLLFGLSRRYSDILIDRAKFHRETVFAPLTLLAPLWVLNIVAIIFAAFGFLYYGVYSASVMTFNLLIVIVWILSTIGLIVLASFGGGRLLPTSEKLRFAAIGVWHSVLQILVPVYLVLYASWANMLIIMLVTYAITHVAGELFTRNFLVKNFSSTEQRKIGNLLFASWGIVGICVLLSASWGEPIAVDGWRLLASFALGAVFSCIWFGWYLAVSSAYNGHNNEVGGGARSENYRHMIRFKITEDTLTGYVIGINEPKIDFSSNALPKFQLVDVFVVKY